MEFLKLSRVSRVWTGNLIQKLKPLINSSAFKMFIIVWVLSMIYIASRSNKIIFPIAGFALEMLFLCAFTIAITDDDSENYQTAEFRSKFRYLIQTVILLVIVFAFGFEAFLINAQVGQQVYIPVWTPIADWLHQPEKYYLPLVAERKPVLITINPILQTFIFLVILLVLGAHLSELGIRRGHRVWHVSVLWVLISLIEVMIQVLSGSTGLPEIIHKFVTNPFGSGFSEEFLFRGFIQTRLRKFLSSHTALIVQAFIFGIAHLGIDTQVMMGNLLEGIALAIALHGIYGLAMGIIFQRTRNILASSLAHFSINLASV